MNGSQGIVPTIDLATNNNGYPYPVYPMMGGFGNSGFGGFGGDGAIWIILIIALLGGFNNGNDLNFKGFLSKLDFDNVVFLDFIGSAGNFSVNKNSSRVASCVCNGAALNKSCNL